MDQYSEMLVRRDSVEGNILLYADTKSKSTELLMDLARQPVVDLARFRELSEQKGEATDILNTLQFELEQLNFAIQQLEEKTKDATPKEAQVLQFRRRNDDPRED